MDKNKDISDWLNASVKDYQRGVDLIERYGSRAAARTYRHASPDYMLPKVEAYLRRLANLYNPSIQSIPSIASAPSKPASIPAPIRRAKDKLHDLWLRLVDFHKRLLALGFDNTDEKKKARVALMTDRAPFVEAFEQLYLLKEEFFAYPEDQRQLPPDLIPLLDRLDGKPTMATDKPIPSIKSIKSTPDFSSLSPLELYKKRHALLMAITRRNNKLRFSQPTPAEQLNPMPDSPKRKAIESEIATLQQQLQEIDSLLNK